MKKRALIYLSLFAVSTFLYIFYLSGYYNSKKEGIKTNNLKIESIWKKHLQNLDNNEKIFVPSGCTIPNDNFTKFIFGLPVENLSLSDIFFIDSYKFFFDKWNIDEKSSFFITNAVWKNIPIPLKTFAEFEDNGLFSYFKAQIYYSYLEIFNKEDIEVPDIFLHFAKNQGINLLKNNYRKEGLEYLYLLKSRLEKRDPEFNCWLSSAHMMQAIDAKTGLEKIKIVESTIPKLENALEEGKENLVCNYIFIETYISLPEFFYDQREQALTCMERLLKNIQEGKDYYYTNETFRQELSKDGLSYFREIIFKAENLKGWKKKEKKRINEMKNVLRKI